MLRFIKYSMRVCREGCELKPNVIGGLLHDFFSVCYICNLYSKSSVFKQSPLQIRVKMKLLSSNPKSSELIQKLFGEKEDCLSSPNTQCTQQTRRYSCGWVNTLFMTNNLTTKM